MTTSGPLSFSEKVDLVSDDISTELALTLEDPKNIPEELLPHALNTNKRNTALCGSIGVAIIVAGLMTDDKMGALIGGSLFLAPAIDGLIRKKKILHILSQGNPLDTEIGKPLNPA